MAVEHYYNSWTATRAEVITWSDTALTTVYKALYFGASGTVKLYDATGTATTLAVVAGMTLPLQSRGIWSSTTSVTANSIIGLFD